MSFVSQQPQSPLFFTLPLEIRQQIYAHLLPSTTTITQDTSTKSRFPSLRSPFPSEYPSTDFLEKNFSDVRSKPIDNGIVWQRGCTSLLAVNKQMHFECADQMYGTNTFVINISYNCIKFAYRWIVLASNLMPNRDLPFLGFRIGYLARIRNYVVHVEQVDSYTGMVKYNCGGPGLPAGLRQQVSMLVSVMASATESKPLHRLHIYLLDSNQGQIRRLRSIPIQAESNGKPWTVLDPFKVLRNVRMPTITGAVPFDYANGLQEAMQS
ncbi:hypothetical protein EJ05DRAFT_512652 [Pseudovirgaria hyperparasitica]|uniref:DUF7730 domain-containing protein n=1 Tax=Pseudovirgaria hyperparasitica TaxID=470096 RepID=A0A6A6VZL5_9PEZI|nr:uncharacterized protein EJ05DRAFT_512652 [Pseudovirgaria hyperparasitica]KAF2756092.1 hypothetical protein EJ05DRAFT_512652 [Pseudovirgaria hyperparasitica]